jgi:hypothetical protein
MVITHPYFDLDAFTNPVDPTILHHTLSMPYSPRFIEIDNIEVPTGALASVHNAPTRLLVSMKSSRIGSSAVSIDSFLITSIICTSHTTLHTLNTGISSRSSCSSFILVTLLQRL